MKRIMWSWIWLVAACQPLTPVDLPAPSPTVNIPLPGASADAGPTQDAISEVSPQPTATPRAPEPEPTVLRPPGHTASAPPAQPLTYPGRLEGTVFDAQGLPLSGVRLRLRSLDSSRPFEAQTETRAGAYLLENLPTGLQLELRAERLGFTPRSQVLSLSEAQAQQTLDFAAANALNDQPEVQAVRPVTDLPVSSRPELVLTFSEPMDRNSVAQQLVLRLAENYTPSVRGAAGELAANTLLWDQRAFVFDWRPDDTQLTLRFRDGAGLPGDSEASRLPRYTLGFKGPILDKLGVSRSQDFFRLGQTASATVSFAAAQDRSLPEIDALQALSAERHGAEQGDLIRVRYNKPMRWPTLGYTLVGGMNQAIAEAPAGHEVVTPAAAAANYRVSVQRGEQTLLSELSWSVLGGQVHFEPLDPLQQIVRLEAPALSVTGDQTAGENLTGTLAAVSGRIYYQDGTDTSFEFTPEASSWTALQTALNSLLDGNPFSARKASNQQGALTSGDSWRITLAAGARSLDTQKIVALVVIDPEGLFAVDRLNAPVGGMRIFPGLAANARANLFQAGDRIQVQIAQSVRDPAGNALLGSASQGEISAD
ncbi:MAG: carboxypeptidase regulatory-like domain-containing protein [Candidatus Sericytochromatia bacterium]|nr:carboxypeptidase regulatory-like domain-containing protein [Candidatus Sericytochromatia bacterium]